jgi:hypothetical protein
MPVDDTTAQQQFPLPHRTNRLGDDVERLRTAITQIDGVLATKVTSEDVTDIVFLSQNDYDELETPDPTTLYITPA